MLAFQISITVFTSCDADIQLTVADSPKIKKKRNFYFYHVNMHVHISKVLSYGLKEQKNMSGFVPVPTSTYYILNPLHTEFQQAKFK